MLAKNLHGNKSMLFKCFKNLISNYNQYCSDTWNPSKVTNSKAFYCAAKYIKHPLSSLMIPKKIGKPWSWKQPSLRPWAKILIIWNMRQPSPWQWTRWAEDLAKLRYLKATLADQSSLMPPRSLPEMLRMKSWRPLKQWSYGYILLKDKKTIINLKPHWHSPFLVAPGQGRPRRNP